jgi:hypothetical protein
MRVFVLCTLAVGINCGAQPLSCQKEEMILGARLDHASLAMEPESVVFTVCNRATELMRKCPASEPAAYLQLRALELGGGMPIGTTTPAIRQALAEASQAVF